MSYAYTHLTHKTITDNINLMHLYYELIRVLLLKKKKAYAYSDLPYELQILFLCRTYAYNRLMFIRDSRRSYRTYSYSGLIFITGLCSFGTPVGVIELILNRLMFIRDSRRSYRTYTYSIDTGVPVGTTGLRLILLIREYL